MKMKKWFGLLFLGLALITLAACGKKSPEDIIKTELKDSYVGSSWNSGYDISNDVKEIVFDKKNHKLQLLGDKSENQEVYYEVVSDRKIPKSMKVILDSHKSELSKKDYFIINVGYHKDDIWGKLGDQLYCVVLTDGGKSIRIFEFETGYTTDGYFDFSGKAK
ncbi:TPA: hypothetical protein TUV11_000907 [Streptococcus equi subsp. zooepidemicus]|nr:hypothetical protein [Streptococcus equi subsp. zooepidemicus]HEL0632279.1 hypothetical protein [Streptococcus equi subsp. zooepidemicus]HEL0802547.1 hypothetical protein [Streptococcus equi subsp. zooepidemicus]HEL1241982.1 hypothetical protein [Streptococcus equi subsp. zooepidemicus]